jgi:hypothetical protein
VGADDGAAVRAVNIPLFRGLRAGNGIDLTLGVVAITDPESDSILNVLNSDFANVGIQLARHFSPVYGNTVSFIRALTTSILQKERLEEEKLQAVGMAHRYVNRYATHLPLVADDYIFLNACVKVGGKDDDMA